MSAWNMQLYVNYYNQNEDIHCWKWTHRQFSPGPSACETDVLPWHHVPSESPWFFTGHQTCQAQSAEHRVWAPQWVVWLFLEVSLFQKIKRSDVTMWNDSCGIRFNDLPLPQQLLGHIYLKVLRLFLSVSEFSFEAPPPNQRCCECRLIFLLAT